jgi:hypothetical protein
VTTAAAPLLEAKATRVQRQIMKRSGDFTNESVQVETLFFPASRFSQMRRTVNGK